MARRDVTHVKRQQSARVPITPSPSPTIRTQKEVAIAGTVYASLEQAIRAGVEALYRELIGEEESFEEEELEPV